MARWCDCHFSERAFSIIHYLAFYRQSFRFLNLNISSCKMWANQNPNMENFCFYGSEYQPWLKESPACTVPCCQVPSHWFSWKCKHATHLRSKRVCLDLVSDESNKSFVVGLSPLLLRMDHCSHVCPTRRATKLLGWRTDLTSLHPAAPGTGRTIWNYGLLIPNTILTASRLTPSLHRQ